MSKKLFKKVTVTALSLALCLSSLGGAGVAQGKKKIAISAKRVTIKVGKYRQLKLKNLSKKNQKKVKWKSRNKKVVKVGKHGKIKGVRKGRAYVIATFKKKKYKCLVTVKKVQTTVTAAPSDTASAEVSASPYETAGASTSPYAT
ncbi:MAG: Ig-like domain-containing protein, partial [Lachnospiraceae bacterium]|nr:Ig-like domain-containing protein [Lachnospiraceae bacterium]